MTSTHHPDSAVGGPDEADLMVDAIERNHRAELELVRAELRSVTDRFTALVLDQHKQIKELQLKLEDLAIEKQVLEMALADVSERERKTQDDRQAWLNNSMRMKPAGQG